MGVGGNELGGMMQGKKKTMVLGMHVHVTVLCMQANKTFTAIRQTSQVRFFSLLMAGNLSHSDF